MPTTLRSFASQELLDKMCNADVWNLLPENTDEIQVVDHGLGASVKREAEQVQSEWLQNEDNWAEWTSGRLSASRRRVLSALWYGEAYDIVCRKFKFCKVFDTNMLACAECSSAIEVQHLESCLLTPMIWQLRWVRALCSGETTTSAIPTESTRSAVIELTVNNNTC